MPLIEYICRNEIEIKNTPPEEFTVVEECGHKQDELRGKTIAGGDDPVICEQCGSQDHMEAQIGKPAWINMGGIQNLKKGWN